MASQYQTAMPTGFWTREPCRCLTSAYCVKWREEYPYSGSATKMYTMMETCDKSITELRSAERAVYLDEQVKDMHAKGYIMTSFTRPSACKFNELCRHEAISATRNMSSTYCKCKSESAASKQASHATHSGNQLQ